MTAVFGWALQRALFEALRADPAISAFVGARIFDNPRATRDEANAGPTILIGEETVRPWGAADTAGAEHRVVVSLVAREGGFGALKQLSALVSDAVLAPMALARGRIVLARFIGIRARRTGSLGLRQVDLTFRIVIEDDGPTP
jgi:hypothetical protein